MSENNGLNDLSLRDNDRRNAQWDLRNAFGNYSVMVVSQVIVAVFSFASVTLCTRKLGTEGYGGIIAVIAASNVAQIFVNWTCVGLARFGVEEFVETGKISKSFWARTLVFLPNSLVFIAFALLLYPSLASWLKLPDEAFVPVAVHFFISIIWLHIQHAVQGAKLPKIQSFLLAAERVFIFLILLLLSFGGNLTWKTAIYAYIFPAVLMILLGLLKLRNLVSWKIDIDHQMLRRLVKFSVPLIPFTLIGYFSTNYLDAIFISKFLSKSDLGIYSVAYQINGILMQFPTLAGSLLMPMFVTLQSKGRDHFIDQFSENLMPLLILGWSALCIISAVAGFVAIPAIFGGEVAAASKVYWILALSAVFSFPSFLLYVPFINKISATYVGLPMALGAAATNLMANYLLIPKYGLSGSAWATVLSMAVSFFIIYILVHLRHELKQIWTLSALIPAVLVVAIFAFTDNGSLAFVSGIAVTLLLLMIYRKSVLEGFKLLGAFRGFVSR